MDAKGFSAPKEKPRRDKAGQKHKQRELTQQKSARVSSDYTPFERITSQLENIIHTQNGQARAICPSHESRNNTRTLAIKESDESSVLIHCFAGCSTAEVLAALGLELVDLFPKPLQSTPGRTFTKKAAFSPREALRILSFEITLASMFMSDVIDKRPILEKDWNRFLLARNRVSNVVVEYEL